MRFALYFTPDPDDPLTIAAQSWLGRNAFDGSAVSMPPPAGFSAEEFHNATADPRRYGFHGTLVAPFRLSDGLSADDLRQAAESFARQSEPFAIPSLIISRIGSFLALTPGDSRDVSALASNAVDHFNGLRAPLSHSEIERRRPEQLSERQRAYLDRYGYPYVKDEFRFHMTLTGSLEPEVAARIEPAAHQHFGSLLIRLLSVSAVAVFVEAEAGANFIVQSIHRFGAAEARKSA